MKEIGTPFIKNLPALLLLSIILMISIKIMAQSNLKDSLPDELNGWIKGTEDRIFYGDDLYDYIDGGAELFLSFGFKEVFSRIYTKPDQPDILIDIFRMNTSLDAFGVFSLSSEIRDDYFGQGSQVMQGAVLFWKNNFFISIITSPETETSKGTILKLAELINDAIIEEGPTPEILNILPKDGLIQESIRYFRHYHWQNGYFFIFYENYLHLNQNTHAVLAKYELEGTRPVLLLIEYLNESDAEKSFKDFAEKYMPELSTKPSVEMPDGTWTGAYVFKNLLTIIFKAPGDDIINYLIDKVKNNRGKN